MRAAVLGAAGPALAAAAAGAVLASSSRRPAWARDDPAQVVLGQRVYARNCAACHGATLQGQPDWRVPGPQGVLPAAPLEQSGHGWQHSDADLIEFPSWPRSAGRRRDLPGQCGREVPEDVLAMVRTPPLVMQATALDF